MVGVGSVLSSAFRTVLRAEPDGNWGGHFDHPGSEEITFGLDLESFGGYKAEPDQNQYGTSSREGSTSVLALILALILRRFCFSLRKPIRKTSQMQNHHPRTRHSDLPYSIATSVHIS